MAVLSQVRLVCYPSCDDEQAERPPFGDGTKNVNETLYACNLCSQRPFVTTPYYTTFAMASKLLSTESMGVIENTFFIVNRMFRTLLHWS